MIKKVCPFCNSESYSSYNDPHWLCPYCKKNIGDSAKKNTQEQNKCSSPKKESRQVFTTNDSRNEYRSAIKD